MVLPINVYVIAASLATIVYLAILFRHTIAKASDTVCALSPTKKCALAVMLLIAVVFGGGKTNTQDNVDGGLTNLLTGAFRSLAHLIDSADDLRHPPVTPADIAFGWQRLGPFTNASVVYTMPDDATLATNWWLRGAFEDVTKIGLEGLEGLGGLGGLEGLEGLEKHDSMWAFTWGKVRFSLADTNEIVAVGAPMSAIPQLSRLWSAADTNGAFRITWENFALGREAVVTNQLQSPIPNPQSLISAQVEFRPNGDYVTRSNELETVWRRIDPYDFDADGYLNGDDPNPFEWDDGADTYYGPYNNLPWCCNEDAYCDVTVEIDGTQSEWVTFTGDGYSDYSDPFFLAKPGVPYDVKILIGKTYRVTCNAPIRAVEKSDDEIVVSDIATNAFTVVWPVTITEAPRLFAAPSSGLLGGSHGNTGFTLVVNPPWLDGVFGWATNSCCHVVDNDGWWEFACEYDCKCCGCQLSGSYTYEGYTVFFSDINCGCRYTPHTGTHWGIAAPPVVFKDGALRPLEITFHHGSSADPEEGELKLEVTGKKDRIRLWNDSEKTSEASIFSWDVSSFNGCTYYVEGAETSRSVNDIKFKLTWERPGGTSVNQTAETTCAEVKETQVDSPTAGITDGSSNQQPFAGHTNWEFSVTHSPRPDKHYAVLFRDVVNTNDFSVRDFSVRMTLDVLPAGAPVGTARWFALDPTPASGAIVSTGPRVGELRNPKVGGVYHIGSCFDGSPTNECNIVLPLAGAAVEDILLEDLARADEFAAFVRSRLDEKQINTIQFGLYFFCDAGRGDYLGRPDNLDFPTVWNYNQVTTSGLQFGKGAVATLFGLPIRISKLSNLLAAYACDKLGVYQELQLLAQWIGTRNDDSSLFSWDCGTALAHGSNYVHSVSNMVRQCWGSSDEKAAKLWPNTSCVDNHPASVYYSDVERLFYSPGMLYFIQQISTRNNQ